MYKNGREKIQMEIIGTQPTGSNWTFNDEDVN